MATTLAAPRRRTAALGAALFGLVAIGALDFATGAELRVFPLYFLPLSVAACEAGRRWTLLVAALCSVAWLGSNLLAGLRFSSMPLLVANFAAQATAFLVVGYLMASLRGAQLRERDASLADPLTGLANRRGFLAEAVRVLALARRRRRAIGIAYLDVDDFKAINDAHGHATGDGVLRRVARVLDEGTRIEDPKGRIGGDEFAVVMTEADAAAARVLLDRLRHSLENELANASPRATVSIGAVVFESAPASLDAMLRAADALMYEAKAGGKNALRIETGSPAQSAAG